jgi:CubicO group peptidase (beta-lactamase class C family)
MHYQSRPQLLGVIHKQPFLLESENTVLVALSRLRWLQLLLLGPLIFISACAAPSAAPGTAPAPSAPPTAVAEAAPTALPEATTAPTALPTAAPTALPEATTAPAVAPTLAPTAEPTATPELALEPFDAELAARLQQVLDQSVADGSIPGMSLAVSLPGREPWAGASGIASRQDGAALTPATAMRMASISKIFTGVIMLQLVEEGLVELDAPLSSFFPDLVPNAERITVRSLLNHTSGLYDFLEDRNYVVRAYQDPSYIFAPAELVGYAARFPPLFPALNPNSWDYSSTNFVILGMIIEQVTGTSMDSALRSRIFEPLGLESTFFVPYETPDVSQARGYSGGTDQTNVAMSFGFATANIVATASDIQRFIDGLVQGELLEPATLETMFVFENGKGQYNMPELEYGLGIMRNRLPVSSGQSGQRDPEQSRVVGHIGGFGGFRSATWHAPANGITIAVGMNQAATDPNIYATRVFETILTWLEEQP